MEQRNVNAIGFDLDFFLGFRVSFPHSLVDLKVG
jgi:hypothetical protein